MRAGAFVSAWSCRHVSLDRFVLSPRCAVWWRYSQTEGVGSHLTHRQVSVRAQDKDRLSASLL